MSIEKDEKVEILSSLEKDELQAPTPSELLTGKSLEDYMKMSRAKIYDEETGGRV